MAYLLLCVGFPAVCFGDGLALHEQEIKAGLLYSFLKYTDWPSGKARTPSIVVCIFGDDPFGGYLKPMEGRSVNQREIKIRSIRDIEQTDSCNLLFVNAGEKDRWPALSKFLAGKNVLTVSDFSGFVDAGGMIEFGHKDNHISAELNLAAANGEKLQVQDRLLKLTTIVHPASSGGG